MSPNYKGPNFYIVWLLHDKDCCWSLIPYNLEIWLLERLFYADNKQS
jgi:hypothetical protein